MRIDTDDPNPEWRRFVQSSKTATISDPYRHYSSSESPSNIPTQIKIQTDGKSVRMTMKYEPRGYGSPYTLSDAALGCEMNFSQSMSGHSIVELTVSGSISEMDIYLKNPTVRPHLPTEKILQEINQLNQSTATDVRSV